MSSVNNNTLMAAGAGALIGAAAVFLCSRTCCSKQDEPKPLTEKPVLKYWDIRTLGGCARLALRWAEIDFVDERIKDSEKWNIEKEQETNALANLPILKNIDVKGGLAQTGAIMSWAAQRSKVLAPANSLEAARNEEMLCTLQEFNTERAKSAYGNTTGTDKGFFAESVTWYLGVLEKRVQQNGTAFLAGSKPLTADLFFVELIIAIRCAAKHFKKGDDWFTAAKYPKLHKIVETVEKDPKFVAHAKAEEGALHNGPSACWK